MAYRRHRSAEPEPDPAPPEPVAGWGRWLVTAVVVAAVASPALRTRDSFPLSTYPVYAQARAGTAVLPAAVGVDGDGERHRLSLPLIADSDDPLIVEERLRDAVADDRPDALCRAVAQRVAGDGTRDRLVAVEVVSERIDLVALVADDAPPRERTVHARCPVGR